MEEFAETHLNSTPQNIKYPILFNLPILYPYLSQNNPKVPIREDSCLQFYDYGFSENSTEETKNFVGWNKGNSDSNSSKGLLSRIIGSYSCEYYLYPKKGQKTRKVNNVPFFNEPTSNSNEKIFNDLQELNGEPYERPIPGKIYYFYLNRFYKIKSKTLNFNFSL